MHVHIFFTTFDQLLKLVFQSFFKFDLCITDSDGLADNERKDDGEDKGHNSFFSSKPVAEDLCQSDGMLIVNVILNRADSVTHIM